MTRAVRSDLHAILRESVDPDGPGIAALVGTGDGAIIQEGYGLADVERRVPITPGTRFVIASVTKQFTATAVMLLEDRDLISFDDTLDEWFSNLPDWRKKVTVRHLLTHTSGIPEYLSDEFFIKSKETEPRLADVLRTISEFGRLDFAPGAKYSYSNSGYILLGELIKKASGVSFAGFIGDNIFEPLRMHDSSVGRGGKMLSGQATGYVKNEGEYAAVEYNRAVEGWADGNIISTVRDLFRWDRALYTEKLLPAEKLKRAREPFFAAGSGHTRYGFGFLVCNRRGLREVWHAGGTLGYSAQLARYPGEESCIILLSNAPDMNLTGIRGRLLHKLLGDRMSRVQYLDSDSVGQSSLRAAEGLYNLLDAGGRPNEDSAVRVQICPEIPALAVSGSWRAFERGETLLPVEPNLYRIDSCSDIYVKFLTARDMPSECSADGMRVMMGGARHTFCRVSDSP